ncbi:alpha/beta fold hydrolase [Pseudoponticoccus marisrubri]|uniref:AB hydrolase-1 domain-containing protein n=1 Tax=Pseudoponticoccus marisrubri TaxID=1685382 RepID=A0A0W7WN62_9RHOB|nr:alpha/beta hydrolase family protein [Pseudoponticoccus marisrubri]KUF11969.1 hypothetical protein AVJ23_05170 [Pseudoponticoccus marisrubri]
MPPRPERLILIHGAWAGAWVWEALVPELAALGWPAEALDLPGDGAHPIPAGRVTAQDYRDTLARAIADGPGPVALVGHSGGGMLVTAGHALCPDRVSHAAWIAGMLLRDGQSFDDIQQAVAGPGQRFGITSHVVVAPDGASSTVPVDKAAALFFNDAEPETARAAAARLTPQPAAGHRMRVTRAAGFDALPKYYLLATQDRSVLPQAQRLMCDGVPKLTVEEIAAGHVPQLTRAAELAARLDRWLRGGGPDQPQGPGTSP